MGKLISVIVVLLLIGGGFWLFKDKIAAPTQAPETNTTTEETDNTLEVTVNLNVKEFTVDATTYSFAPATMTVNKGDTVKITLKNAKGNHDLVIDEFNAATKVLTAGQEETITFVADKAGTFEYYCSVGTHRQMGMVGKLTVK